MAMKAAEKTIIINFSTDMKHINFLTFRNPSQSVIQVLHTINSQPTSKQQQQTPT
jgi:hypothetical protein